MTTHQSASEEPSRAGSQPETHRGRVQVLVVYQILHHFRDPIFSRLVSRETAAADYEYAASRENDIDSNATLDPARADLPTDRGGLPWTFIRNHKLPGPFLWQSGVVGLAAGHRFDVIVFLGNMYFLSTWVAALVARLRGKRVLFWGHGYLREEANLKGWLRERFYRLGHGALLYGQRAKAFMIDRGFAADDLYVVYNSLDYDEQKAIREATDDAALAATRARLFEDPTRPILVCIGRLDLRKRLDLLLDSVTDLERGGLAVNLLLIGEGPARAELEARAAELGLSSRVLFYGPCFDESEVGPLLMCSTLCVCPGAVGLTAIHAMAYGLPVLSHDAFESQGPEVEAIVPGETGDLYEWGDAADMTARIDSWIRTHEDRAHTASACIERIEYRYNAAHQADIIDAAVMAVPAGVAESRSIAARGRAN